MDLRLLDQKISETLKKYITDETPGLALLIGEKGKIQYRKAFGLANLEKKEYAIPENKFFIASITKPFTTMAIMMLKERGLLEYDETIERFFPDFPSYVKKVTIRNFLTHTSGIKEYFTEDFFKKAAEIGKKMNLNVALDSIKDLGDLEFEPGTKFAYRNSSYVMLGAIVEKLSNMPFDQFVDKNIFKTLGMKDSIVAFSLDQKFDQLATGYILQDDEKTFEKAPYDMATIGWADGNIVSTVDDLFIWHNALYTEKLVSKETFEEALTSYVLKDGTPTGYGFGWYIDNRRGLKEIFHSGCTIGYSSYLTRFVEDDVAIIILNNYMGLDVIELLGEIIEIYLNDRLSPICYIDVKPNDLRAMTGKYESSDLSCDISLDTSCNKLKVCSDRGRLYGEHTLSPVGELQYRLDTPADYYLTFKKTDNFISGFKVKFNGGIPLEMKKV